MIKKSYSWKLFFLIMVASLLSGCSKGSSQFTETPTNIPLSTKTSVPVTITAMPSATLTPTVTKTHTPTRTPTNIPTLPPTKALERILALYANNGGCKFPCWWGITVGKTTWSEAEQILAPLGSVIQTPFEQGVTYYSFSFDVPADIDPMESMTPGLYVKENIVFAIGLNCSWIQDSFDCSLAGLLERFGKPEEIWIKLDPWIKTDPFAMGTPSYYLTLFYPSQGIELAVNGDLRGQEEPFRICPSNFKLGSLPPGITVWEPNDDVTFQNFYGSFLGKKISNDDYLGYYLLEDYTHTFDTNAFYKTYLDPGTTTCFDIDLNKIP
jgi:hypothetical protein